MEYTVFWVGGNRDGEILLETDDRQEAVAFAEDFYTEHKTEFHECWGGVSVTDSEWNTIW